MRYLSLLLGVFCAMPSAYAFEILNLNVFDQLQGRWEEGLRERRMLALADFIRKTNPDLVLFQEAKGLLSGRESGGADSVDAQSLSAYPYRHYVHEMTGQDGASYGYWIGSKLRPEQWIEDGFSFPGGVARKVQAAVFELPGGCLGVLSLHLSYQSSAVRVQEARWLLEWLRERESLCSRWLVAGDFNADRSDAEMQILFQGGLVPLPGQGKPTVGAFNPIRRIYGENTPSRTIDWALGWNLEGRAEVVLDSPWNGEWVSDHAGLWIQILDN